MALSIEAATAYISANVITSEDWTDCDDAKKTRILNVASQTLSDMYADYIIPDEAVYEFCATLATVFNDTNKYQQQGVAGFSVTGVGSFTFKDNNVSSVIGQPLDQLVPKRAILLIDKANGITTARRVVGWII